MKLICAPETFEFSTSNDGLQVLLYGQSDAPNRGSAGASARHEILRSGLAAAPRAWDLLSIALSVVTADLAELRNRSPDGWTREFDLRVAVAEPEFWSSQASSLEAALAFLTTDRWRFSFVGGGALPGPPRELVSHDEDCVVLLSGGLDSLIGLIDRAEEGKKPLALSHRVRGDAEKQSDFAQKVGVRHLQLNHNAKAPGSEEPSQRARSFIFLAFGVLAATMLARYREEYVPMYICENGFIALNPPLTGARIGSLSTRTAHPAFLGAIQRLLDSAGIRVRIENPYSFMTKGEMLIKCGDQDLLRNEAAVSTSCGRFLRFNYRHCGRCVPCQVRRAAFLAWKETDTTTYVYENLGQNDTDHAGSDDVRSVAMALAEINTYGLEAWLGSSLSTSLVDNVTLLQDLLQRGFGELAAMHAAHGVK